MVKHRMALRTSNGRKRLLNFTHMSHIPRWFYHLAFASVIAGVVMVVAGSTIFGAPPTCQRILLPGYFYPGPLWRQAASARGTWMIINPASGSGTAISQDYVKNVASIQSAGLKAIGYVSTRYASRPIEEVKTDIENYYTWYGVSGIFLDEMPTDAAQLAYYQNIVKSIRLHAGSVVVLNPGTVPDQRYVDLGDTTVVFEGTYAEYNRASFPAWMSTYQPTKFAHLVYGTGSKYLSATMRRARSLNAGFVYVTNDTLPNPWDTLPPYWTTEKDTAASICF